ncbi:MAG: hypothetical protein MJZ37_07885 [Bacilli bacterium]|nr:hypothetical protein [Bacilli bacterium]
MAVDIVPEMLESIKNEFQKKIINDPDIKALTKKLREGNADYEDANAYAVKVGELLSKTFGQKIKIDLLPDGRMYFNIADRVVGTMLDNMYKLSADYSQKVQSDINKKNGYGLAGISGKVDPDRKRNFIDKISDSEEFADVDWMLGESVVNYSQAAVSDTIKANAEFQANAGVKGTIERILAPGCCAWCEKLAGTYSYPDVPAEVYMKHKDCGCELIYTPKANNGNKRIVWSKR